jgi:hypothetical protein
VFSLTRSNSTYTYSVRTDNAKHTDNEKPKAGVAKVEKEEKGVGRPTKNFFYIFRLSVYVVNTNGSFIGNAVRGSTVNRPASMLLTS